MKSEEFDVPKPPESKFVFALEGGMRIRFNADGWVEEIGKGIGDEDMVGTRLQGSGGTKMDDVYARRIYDLYSRVVIYDLHPRRSTEQAVAAGLLAFKDLEPGSHVYTRLTKIIEIANEKFTLNIRPLQGA